MSEDRNFELIFSINKELDKKIEKTQSKLKREKDKLNDTTKKLSMLDKMLINSDIKNYQEQLRKLSELSQSIGNLKSSKIDKYSIPNELKSQFDLLGTLLSEKEIKQIREDVKDCVGNVNKQKREVLKQSITKIQKLFDQLNIGNNSVLIYNIYNQYMGDTTFFNSALKEIEATQIKKLISEYYFINYKPAEIKLSISDELFISSLDEMIKSNEFKENNNIKNIIDNFGMIKETFYEKEKIKRILSVISNTLVELGKISEVDFSKTQSFLKKIEANYKKELGKLNNFLESFDFSDVKTQIEDKRVQEEKNKLENSKITKYQQFAYELEKIMTENPNDYNSIKQIREAMADMQISSGLTHSQLENAAFDGKMKYQNELKEQKARVEAVKEKNAYEDQLKADVMKQLREYAIYELESSGAFEEQYEFRNGDVYSQPMDRESMIQSRIESLKSLADMTPEQRGLEDYKKSGLISSIASLEDLTPQQIMDFRVGYRDSSYPFMEDYKRWKAREQIKPQANNIYKEYIRYRASLEDKTQFLSFSEYAKQIHNIENISEIMVDEELKEEMRGKSI